MSLWMTRNTLLHFLIGCSVFPVGVGLQSRPEDQPHNGNKSLNSRVSLVWYHHALPREVPTLPLDSSQRKWSTLVRNWERQSQAVRGPLWDFKGLGGNVLVCCSFLTYPFLLPVTPKWKRSKLETESKRYWSKYGATSLAFPPSDNEFCRTLMQHQICKI